MRRVLLCLVAAAIVVPASAASADGFNFSCPPGQSVPVDFVGGFADLNAALGGIMGQPTECEHSDPQGSGDTLQHTTGGRGFGLAYWRKSTNTPMWFDGATHYALTSAGVVSWTGRSVDPPTTPDAAAVAVPPAPVAPPPSPVVPQATQPTANLPDTVSPGDTFPVVRSNWAWLVVDGRGKALTVEAAEGLGLGDPKALAMLTGDLVRGNVKHLGAGTQVTLLDPPGSYFSHVQLLDGSGTTGNVPNKAFHS